MESVSRKLRWKAMVGDDSTTSKAGFYDLAPPSGKFVLLTNVMLIFSHLIFFPSPSTSARLCVGCVQCRVMEPCTQNKIKRRWQQDGQLSGLDPE